VWNGELGRIDDSNLDWWCDWLRSKKFEQCWDGDIYVFTRVDDLGMVYIKTKLCWNYSKALNDTDIKKTITLFSWVQGSMKFITMRKDGMLHVDRACWSRSVGW